MKTVQRPCRRFLACAALAVAGVASAPALGLEGELRETMRSLVGHLATLLEASSAETFDPRSEAGARLGGSLEAIREHASALAEHLERDDVAFIAAALERQIRVLDTSAAHGDVPGLRLAVDRTVGACVGCHVRTSTGEGTRLASTLVPESLEARLPPLRRARLQVATRRFEAARATLEALLERSAGDAALAAAREYLDLSVRLLPAPSRALERLAARGEPFTSWRDGLRRWSSIGSGPAELARAERAFRDARRASDPDRARVEFLVAAGESERWLDRALGDDHDAALAYLIMGVSEHALMPEAWLPLPELYLEQSIRLAPDTPTAREAMVELERVVRDRYAPAAPPKDVLDYLQQLDRLAGARAS